MAEIKTIVCDNCAIHKKDANHWWVIEPQGQGLYSGPMSVFHLGNHDVHHYCGRECLQAAIERYCDKPELASLKGK